MGSGFGGDCSPMRRKGGAWMMVRQRLLIGIGAVLAAAPAFGQAPASKPAPAPATRSSLLATKVLAAPREPGVPRTLAEALAATYANQPALQAERAKLR